MFSDIHVYSKANPGERPPGIDYHHSPEYPHRGPANWAMNHSQLTKTALSHFFEIVRGDQGVYVLVGNHTGRTDAGGRPISNYIVLRTRDESAALQLFDARHKLLAWSEKRFFNQDGGSDAHLAQLVAKTRHATTKITPQLFTTRPIVEQIPNPVEAPRTPQPGLLKFAFLMLTGQLETPTPPPRFIQRQVGISHAHIWE